MVRCASRKSYYCGGKPVNEIDQIELMAEEKELKNIFDDIVSELRCAEAKFPRWPNDPVHGAAIVAEESGELVKAAIDWYYGRGKPKDVEGEAIQTAAMAIRFLIFMKQASVEEPEYTEEEELPL